MKTPSIFDEPKTPQMPNNSNECESKTRDKSLDNVHKLSYNAPSCEHLPDQKNLTAQEKLHFLNKARGQGPQNRNYDKRKWLNVKELAEYLGTTPGAIRNMVYRDKIVAYKPFGHLLFNKKEIDRKIEASRVLAWYEKD